MSGRKSRDGLTLIEVSVLLCLIGTLLAVGLPAFARALRTSKMSEAPREIQRMFTAVAAYYAAPQPQPSAPPQPATRGAASKKPPPEPSAPPSFRTGCLPAAAGPTPENASVAPVEVDFAAVETPGSATWRAIGYTPAAPIRFRYTLTPQRAGCGVVGLDADEPAVILRAEGDLDGDGVMSRFERNASMSEGGLVLDPLLLVRDRVE